MTAESAGVYDMRDFEQSIIINEKIKLEERFEFRTIFSEEAVQAASLHISILYPQDPKYGQPPSDFPSCTAGTFCFLAFNGSGGITESRSAFVYGCHGSLHKSRVFAHSASVPL